MLECGGGTQWSFYDENAALTRLTTSPPGPLGNDADESAGAPVRPDPRSAPLGADGWLRRTDWHRVDEDPDGWWSAIFPVGADRAQPGGIPGPAERPALRSASAMC